MYNCSEKIQLNNKNPFMTPNVEVLKWFGDIMTSDESLSLVHYYLNNHFTSGNTASHLALY